MNREGLLRLLCPLVLGAVLTLSAVGLYNEPFRPQFHFSPAKNWTNDPNGLVFYKGEYHLFYQYNPFGDVWGHMSWGHAVSRDLVHWEHLPVALWEEDGIMIYSGSAVVDWHNSSGLCQNPEPNDESCLIAIYTGRTETLQTQNIAFSNDRGRTWTKYEKNPVLDLGMRDFRDPKVFWHEESKQWVMVVVLARQQKVRFFGSEDLKQWTMLSDFGPEGATGGVWECPDLFPLAIENEPGQVRWILEVDLNPGAIAGGSGGQYFVGHFDGKTFTNENPPSVVLWQDHGKDFYASMSFSDIPPSDGRRIWMAWFSNWQYARVEPTSPWRGAQSLPRVLKLKRFPEGLRLVQEPIAELRVLRGEHLSLKSQGIAEANRRLRGLRSETFETIVLLDLGKTAEAGLKVRKGDSEETVIGVRKEPPEIFVDRTRSGLTSFHEEFAGRHSGPLSLDGNTVTLHVFVDRSSVEVFGNDGRTVISDRIFPSAGSDRLEVYSTGADARVVSLNFWRLRSAWTSEASLEARTK